MSRGLHRLPLAKPIYEIEDRITPLEAAPGGAHRDPRQMAMKLKTFSLAHTSRSRGPAGRWARRIAVREIPPHGRVSRCRNGRFVTPWPLEAAGCRPRKP